MNHIKSNQSNQSINLSICPSIYLSTYLSLLSDTFATSEPPKVLQNECVLYILTCKCAWRHSRVPFFDIRPSQSFISPLATWLRTRRFSEPTFRPSRPTNHWKNTAIRFFLLTFARLYFLLTLLLCSAFLTPLVGSAFHLSILSEV